MNDTSKITNHGNKANTNDTPPVYDASGNSQRDGSQVNRVEEPGRRSKQDAYRSAPPSYDGYQPEPVAPEKHSPAANNSVPSRGETEEEKKERKRQQLERRRFMGLLP